MRAFATVYKKRFEWLTSFLKRRWMLLSCASVLLVCSAVDLRLCFEGPTCQGFGLCRGEFYFYEIYTVGKGDLVAATGIGWPNFGGWLTWRPGGSGNPNVRIPLWLPLSAILAWIVIGELRWHEKRAKAAEGILP